MKKSKISKAVKEELNQILEGAGWATDQYVINFTELTDPEQYDLCMELAKLGRLFDEEKIEELPMGRAFSIPTKGKITVKAIKSGYFLK